MSRKTTTMTPITLQTFEFAPGMSLRTIVKDGQPWFLASDATAALGYVDGRKALADHLDADERGSVSIRHGIAGNPNRTVINESGLYSLILASKKPEAKAFRKWVTSVVLPALRQGGVYVVGQEKVDLASMSYEQVRKHIEAMQATVAEAEAIRWALHKEEKRARTVALRFFR